jgi:VWFA-related protein
MVRQIMMKKRLLPAAFLIAHLSGAAFAQQPNPTPQSAPPPPVQQSPAQKPEDVDVVRITTNLVQVDAVITDKSGKVITDLKRDEVQIFEDGKQQKITHFSFVVTETVEELTATKPKNVDKADKNAPPIPSVVLKPEQVKRTIAIVLDDLGLSFESTAFVRKALKKFVDEQMQPGDLVAIIRTSGGIGALQSFTSDKRQLYAAIEHLQWYPNGRAGILAVSSYEPDPIAGAIAGAENPTIPTDNPEQARTQSLSVGTLGALTYVVKGLRDLPGRKSILLISDGFQINNSYTVIENLHHLVDQTNRSSVVIYTMNATQLQTLGLTAADFTSGYDPLSAPDQRGAQLLADRRAAALDLQEGLDYLARETGGIAIRNTNDLSGGIRRVMKDQNYYLIGYRPDESTFDPRTGRHMFHKLSLKVTRPGDFNARMRNGFFGASDEEASPGPVSPAQQLIAGLESPFGAADVHVRLTSLFGNTAKFGSYMRSMLFVNARDLTFTNEADGSHKAELSLLAIAFGDNGNPLEQISGPASLRVPASNYERFLQEGFVYVLTVPIKKPGAYQLRVAVRDKSSGRVGSASQFVEVPDVKKNWLSLSGIAATSVAPSAGTQPASQNAKAFDPTQSAPNDRETLLERDAANPLNSAAVRQFHSGEVLRYGFVVFNARVDKATNAPQVHFQTRLFRDGQVVFAGKDESVNPANQFDMKRLNTGGAIHLGANLTPGEYILQVIATDQLADDKHRLATQWIDFQIVK